MKTSANKMPKMTFNSPHVKTQSSAADLKSRLEWGQPALTILDVRQRQAFNKGHIMGAMSMPLDGLADDAKSSLDLERDIYIYGESEEQTSEAAASLRNAGFRNVAELKGGLAAWESIGGPTEGTDEIAEPGSDAYNVVSRISHQMNLQKITKSS